jgi:hypothetical protein
VDAAQVRWASYRLPRGRDAGAHSLYWRGCRPSGDLGDRGNRGNVRCITHRTIRQRWPSGSDSVSGSPNSRRIGRKLALTQMFSVVLEHRDRRVISKLR